MNINGLFLLLHISGGCSFFVVSKVEYQWVVVTNIFSGGCSFSVVGKVEHQWVIVTDVSTYKVHWFKFQCIVIFNKNRVLEKPV